MREFTFTEADVAALRHERFYHPHPRVQEKMEVLWLKSRGVPHTEIARLTDLSRRTVQRYLDEYLDGGIEALLRVNFHRPKSDLAGHAQSLEDYFLENPPRSAREAQRVIEELTGLRRSLTQVRVFLHRAGLVLAEARPGAGQGGPGETGRVPAGRAAAPARAGGVGAADGPVRGRGALRVRPVPGVRVGGDPAVPARPVGAAAVQRAGGLGRGDARAD